MYLENDIFRIDLKYVGRTKIVRDSGYNKISTPDEGEFSRRVGYSYK